MLIRHFRMYVSAIERQWLKAQEQTDESSKWLHSESVAWLQSAMHDHFERVIALCKERQMGPYGSKKLSEGFVADLVPLKDVVTYYSELKERDVPNCRDAWLAHLCMVTNDTDWGNTVEEFMEHLVAAIYTSYKFLVVSDKDALTEFSESVARVGVPLDILDLAKNKGRAEAIKWQIKEIINTSTPFQEFHHWWVRYQYLKPLTNGRIVYMTTSESDNSIRDDRRGQGI